MLNLPGYAVRQVYHTAKQGWLHPHPSLRSEKRLSYAAFNCSFGSSFSQWLDSVALLPSTDGRIYIIDLKTGTKIWSYEAGIPIIGTPVILDGLIVVATQDGTVFGFGSSGL